MRSENSSGMGHNVGIKPVMGTHASWNFRISEFDEHVLEVENVSDRRASKAFSLRFDGKTAGFQVDDVDDIRFDNPAIVPQMLETLNQLSVEMEASLSKAGVPLGRS